MWRRMDRPGDSASNSELPRRALALRRYSRRPPPMHALEAFDVAARLGSFSQAAHELCVTQSAISHRIRLLEEHLGTLLFARVHRQVVLTPDGERFLSGVREAIRHITKAADAVVRRHACVLRIASAPALASHVLIPHLRGFLDRHPGLEIEIDTAMSMVDLFENNFDVALRFGIGPWPGLRTELLLEERVFPLSSSAYASHFGSVRTSGTLAHATLIHTRVFSWQQWFKSAGAPGASGHVPGIVLPDMRAALDAAVHGLGVVLANQLVSLELREKRLLVPFVKTAIDLHRHYYAVYRSDASRLDEIRSLLDWLRPILAATAPCPLPPPC